MTGIVAAAAALCTAAGVIAGLLAFAMTGQGVMALRLAVELWTAAGLLRLAGPPSWRALVGAAAILVLRQLLNLGLRHSPLRGLRLRDLLGRPPRV